jgi:hypothetical protein
MLTHLLPIWYASAAIIENVITPQAGDLVMHQGVEPPPDQLTGRGAGRKRQTAVERREKEHQWNTTGRSHDSPNAKDNFESERRLRFRPKSSAD